MNGLIKWFNIMAPTETIVQKNAFYESKTECNIVLHITVTIPSIWKYCDSAPIRGGTRDNLGKISHISS